MKQKTTRRKFTVEFKAKVALDAIKEQQSLSELSRKYEVSSVLISRWNGEFLANAAAVFTNLNETEKSTEDVKKLYAQIGKLKVEVDLLKKVSARLGI
jgi:transposase-like protein